MVLDRSPLPTPVSTQRASVSGRAPGTARESTARAPLSAREVHDRLRAALAELQRAERNAVLWFSEIVRRRLYRDLGYGSIHQYAELALGFKKSKTSQFLRLSQSLKELPGLRRSMAAGELSWTKAREVARVATPGTETAWIREAKQTSSRALEARVKETRRRGREALSPVRGQGELGAVGEPSCSVSGGQTSGLASACSPSGSASGNPASAPVSADSASSPASSEASVPAVPSAALTPSVPMDVHLRMTPEQAARYQALIEALRKRGRREDRVELVLGALEQLALATGAAGMGAAGRVRAPSSTRPANGAPDPDGSAPSAPGARDPDAAASSVPGARAFTRVNSRSPYQVVVQQCPDCGSGRVATGRGDRKLAPRELRAILCDAQRRAPGKRNRAAVPERVRREVLQRDRFRCRSAGCGGASFLAVHHLVPRERGGGNAPENLITLCSGCHRALHARE